MTVTRQHGIIITAVTGVLFGCTAVLICVSSLLSLLGTISDSQELYAPALLTANAGMICGSLAFVSLPIIFYFLLVRGREDAPPRPAPGPDADKPARVAASPPAGQKAPARKPAKRKSDQKTESQNRPDDGSDEGLIKTIVQE